VLLYTAYTAYLVLDSTGHDALTGFTTVMLWFVLPLVAATLTATLLFELRQRQRRRQPAAPHPRPYPADPSP
jgi:cation:H+ antiporter